jgi:sterol desaturase/sphingolipid hydroxylase (fatty acid hydroxylase superfamily)
VNVRWELVSPLVIVGAALLLVGLERRFPYTPGQPVLRRGFWMDLLGYTLLQSWALGVVISWIIRGLDGASGLSRLHLVSGWPVGLQLLFFFVEHDLYIYLFHRWQHHDPRLWRLHEAHHSTPDVDWLSGSRSHALEILVNQTIEFAPMVLLGASPVVPILKGALDAVWGMWIHSNVDARTGWLQRLVNGPEMHRWHHALEATDVERHGAFNFATKLAVWDWLFGTAWLPGHKPRGYGLPYPFPDGYLRQHLFAFRPLGVPSEAAPSPAAVTHPP